MLITKPSFRGVGLAFRPEAEKEIVAHLDKFDVVEVGTERLFSDRVSPSLQTILASKPVIFHGLKMSLAADQPLDAAYFNKAMEVVQRYKPLWFSDHLGFTSVDGGFEVDQFMPARRSSALLDRVTEKLAAITNCDTPFLVENITYYFDLPGAEYTEPLFISKIIERSNCGLLLDLSNLYINAVNHDYDPYEFLEKIPLDQVVEIHMAGGDERNGVLVDSHGYSISEPVWALLEHVCKRSKVNVVIIERDRNIDFDDILESVARARRLLMA